MSEQTQVVTVNNTGLKPQMGDNYDVSLEYYLKPAGLLSIGAFQKDVSDFVFAQDVGTIGTGVNNGFNGQYAGYLLRSQTNGGSARMRGLEVSLQHQFSNELNLDGSLLPKYSFFYFVQQLSQDSMWTNC